MCFLLRRWKKILPKKVSHSPSHYWFRKKILFRKIVLLLWLTPSFNFFQFGRLAQTEMEIVGIYNRKWVPTFIRGAILLFIKSEFGRIPGTKGNVSNWNLALIRPKIEEGILHLYFYFIIFILFFISLFKHTLPAGP